MRNIIVGQILKNGKVMGTGFLVEADIVMTAKHNVITADELLEDELEEKVIEFCINGTDKVSGKTINLLQSIEQRIDCVIIRLSEILSEEKMYGLVEAENQIDGAGCQIIGFPKCVTDVGRILRTFKIKKNVEVTDNGKIII